MSELSNEPDCYSSSTHKAVREFAKARYVELARKVIARLQRIKASGIYGGSELGHRTIWDEFCYEQHEGSTEPLVKAWNLTTHPFLDVALRTVPDHEAMLLTIGAAWDFETDNTPDGIDMGLIRARLEQAVIQAALNRNMHRLVSARSA